MDFLYEIITTQNLVLNLFVYHQLLKERNTQQVLRQRIHWEEKAENIKLN